MRRIGVGIGVGTAILGLTLAVVGERSRDPWPRLPSAVEGEEVGGAGAEEGPGRGSSDDARGARRSLELGAAPEAETRLAAAGEAASVSSSREDAVRSQTAPAPAEGALSRAELEAFEESLARFTAPWERREDPERDQTLVGPSTFGPGVTQRAYEIEGALSGLRDDGAEVAPDPLSHLQDFAPQWTGDGHADWRRLVSEVYVRTGEPLWRVAGTGLAEAPFRIGGAGALPGWPLFVRQTLEGHRRVEAVLDDLVTCGGDARTVRVWEGALSEDVLTRGEVRRVEQPVPWSSTASATPIDGPIELDVPATRAVTAFFGIAHAVLADYVPEVGDGLIWPPVYAVAHEGRSVRARGIPETSELELEFRDAHQAPAYPTFSCVLGPDGDASSLSVTIEVPCVVPLGVVARVPALEGGVWLVGLEEGRAALVKVGASVPGAGPRRRGWRAPHEAWNPPSGPGEVTRTETVHAEARQAPPTWMRACLERPPGATDAAAPPRTLNADPRTGALEFARFDDVEGRHSQGVFGYALNGPGSDGSCPSQDLPCAGTRIQARWAGHTTEGAAYDVLLSVADPVGTRDGPPTLRDGAYLPVRLPSFRRVLLPMRIFVPNGGVGRRTVTLDVGRGPEPWTVSLSGGRRDG